jgi:hypothetical protein
MCIKSGMIQNGLESIINNYLIIDHHNSTSGCNWNCWRGHAEILSIWLMMFSPWALLLPPSLPNEPS